MHRIAILLVLALSPAACSQGDARADATSSSESRAAGSGNDRSPASGSADRLQVTLSTEPFAGTHEASGNMECFMLEGAWTATFEQSGDTGITAMLVMLKGIPAAGGTSKLVNFTAVFGRPDDERGDAAIVDVHGAELGGNGRGTVTRDGRGAVLKVEGTTHYGAQVTASVRCASVNFLT